MTATAALHLRPLTFLVEGDDVVVGCAQTDSYAVLPPDGAALLDRLGRESAQEAQRWYEATYGEAVDVDDFVDSLRDLDFIEPTRPGTTGPDPTGPACSAAPRLRWQRTGAWLFGPAGWLGMAALVAVAVGCLVRDPALAPRTHHVFFARSLLVIELTVAFGQIPLILVHEAFHVLAARRLGIPARIGISHRLYFVVFETSMDGLVMVPRARRYLPMLAGMLADLLLVCALTVVAAVTGTALVRGVCLALAFSTLLRFALEFVLFLRTDVYYLIGTLAGTVDLHGTSTQLVANAWWQLVGRPDRRHDPEQWHPRDRQAARWYTPVHVLGYALAVVLLVSVLLPISWRFAELAGRQLLHPHPGSPLFWDALGLLVLNTAQPVVAGLLALRERARRLAARSARTTRRRTRDPVPQPSPHR